MMMAFGGETARWRGQRQAVRVICVQYSPGSAFSSTTAERQGVGEAFRVRAWNTDKMRRCLCLAVTCNSTNCGIVWDIVAQSAVWVSVCVVEIQFNTHYKHTPRSHTAGKEIIAVFLASTWPVTFDTALAPSTGNIVHICVCVRNNWDTYQQYTPPGQRRAIEK